MSQVVNWDYGSSWTNPVSGGTGGDVTGLTGGPVVPALAGRTQSRTQYLQSGYVPLMQEHPWGYNSGYRGFGGNGRVDYGINDPYSAINILPGGAPQWFGNVPQGENPQYTAVWQQFQALVAAYQAQSTHEMPAPTNIQELSSVKPKTSKSTPRTLLTQQQSGGRSSLVIPIADSVRGSGLGIPT